MKKFALILFLSFLYICSLGQDTHIYTKEGQRILDRRELINSCLKSLHKNRNDKTALSICECQANKLNDYFSNEQVNKYTYGRVVDISGLINQDTIIKTEIEKCYTTSNKMTLLQAEGFQQEFISECIKGIQKNTEKTLDISRVKKFCICQLELIKAKKISDAEITALSDPNSLLFYEMLYKCGDPFTEEEKLDRNWNENVEKDITGPAIDTIRILSLNGMTYVKVKVGSMTQFWLFDTGASDLLINKDMEESLKKENKLTEKDYLGTGEYEMANGMIDTCRRYKMDNIKIGSFSINNVVVAVTEKGKKIIAGRALLNKFCQWVINNRDNTLTLTK